MNTKSRALSNRALHLDTHVVCWLFAGLVDQLSDSAQTWIESNDLQISPWVLSELQVLYERGVLRLGAFEILSDLERRLGLGVASGDPLAIIKASLDLSWAQDPYDRMIAAHARLLQAPLLSKDAHLHTHFPQVVW